MIHTIFTHPQVLGLILDIVGAFYIVQGFIFKNSKDLVAESWGTSYPKNGYSGGMSDNLFRGFYKQAIEAKTGFVVLALGFLGQIVGILFPELLINFWFGIIIIVSALLIPRILFKYMYKSDRIDRIERSADEELSKKYE